MRRVVSRVLAVTALLAGGSVFAQSTDQPPSPGRIEIPVDLANITTMRVTRGGLVQTSPYSPRACSQVVTHTDASFSGGTFNAQGGMVQGEGFAATYTLTASAFPIKLDLAEVLWATANATVSTTTSWTVQVWSGTPATGALVASETSDDVVLPYVRMGPGTNGVNLQFSIDAGDPDQIIINDDGTHKFSVGFIIAHHNAQPPDACTTAPQCCNAFLCTDTSGLAQPSANWLYAINCPLGCSAGWKPFNQVLSLCRPTGDVIIRATWSSVTCQPGVGACCYPDGHCEPATNEVCVGAGGIWRGEFTDCSTANCPAPSGACCFANGFCTVLSPATCTGAGGTYLGNGVQCVGTTCPLGACCLPNGSCASGITEAACTQQGGLFGGVGSTCDTACPVRACCLPNGSCVTATHAQCNSLGGTWQANITSCANANCPQPDGACCTPGFCFVTTQAICAGIPQSGWKGPFTTCVDNNNNGTADICEGGRCVADYNEDGGIDGSDVEAFFISWAAGQSLADVNEDGGVDGGDVEYFFVRWEAGSC